MKPGKKIKMKRENSSSLNCQDPTFGTRTLWVGSKPKRVCVVLRVVQMGGNGLWGGLLVMVMAEFS